MVFGLDKKTKKNKTNPQLYQPGGADEPPPTSAVMPDEPAPAFTLPDDFTTIDDETGEVVVDPVDDPEPVPVYEPETEPVFEAPVEDPNETVWIENVFGQKLKTKRKKVSKHDTVIDDPKAPGGALELVNFVNDFGQTLQARRGDINDQSQIVSAVGEDVATEDSVEVDETGNLTVSKKSKNKKAKADYTGLYIIGGISLGLIIFAGAASN